MHETGMQVPERLVSLEKGHLKRQAAALDGQLLLCVATWKGADNSNYMVITPVQSGCMALLTPPQ